MKRKPKVIIITGVSSGIGRTTAERLARRGHLVFGTARKSAQTNPVNGVQLLDLDVRDEVSAAACVQEVVRRSGRIDVLVNNAGYALFGAAEETSPAEAQTLFDTNLFGVHRMIQAVLPIMRQQRSGLLVNVSSVLGFLPAPYLAFYAAAKHALEGYSESLDHEIRAFGVRAVLIEPDFTKTRFEAHMVRAAERIDAYQAMEAGAMAALAANLERAPGPGIVASEIMRAIEQSHRMRRPAGGRARLLSRLRRFMPHAPVDRSIRRVFGLAGGANQAGH